MEKSANCFFLSETWQNDSVKIYTRGTCSLTPGEYFCPSDILSLCAMWDFESANQVMGTQQQQATKRVIKILYSKGTLTHNTSTGRS